MLKGIPPILSPELLKVLCEMGHSDRIVIGDGNFPAETMGKNAIVIRCDGHDSEVRAKALLEKNVQKCLVKSKTAQQGFVELNMEIRLSEDNTDFINELSALDGVQSAVLVSYNGEYMS